MTDASWNWLIGEVLQRRTRSTPDQFLSLAEESIIDRDIVRLSERKQAEALHVIAVEAGSRLHDGSVTAEGKAVFLLAVPQLLASVQSPRCVDPVLYFWEQLLAPGAARFGVEMLDAVRIALGQQLSSAEPLLRWSAARAIPLLPKEVAEMLAESHVDAFKDSVLRELAFPRSRPTGKN